jgi:hypothetical protein
MKKWSNAQKRNSEANHLHKKIKRRRGNTREEEE